MNTLNVYNMPVSSSVLFEALAQTKTWLRFMRPSDGKNTWYIGTVRQTLSKFTLHDERENVTDSKPVDPSEQAVRRIAEDSSPLLLWTTRVSPPPM